MENGAALTQTAFADETGVKSDVTFATTGAWTSSIAEGAAPKPASMAIKSTSTATKSANEETGSWRTITPDHGDAAGKYTVTITLTPNTTGEDRTATITVSCNGTNITITVTQKAIKEDGTVLTPTTVTLDATEMSLFVGETGYLTVIVLPDNATNQVVTWNSSNPNVATVDTKGTVIAVGVGETVITVAVKTDAGNFTATCTVTVTEEPEPPVVSVTGVMFNNPNSMTLFVGNEGYLYAAVLPDNATNKDVTWTSSKPGVATVDTKGTVIAVSVGETVITVKTVDGGFTATCTVTVTEVPVVSVTGVMLNPSNYMALFVGDKGSMYAIVLPDNATNKDVTWTSSKPGVATVDTKGTVIAVGVGETDITVKTVDGSFTATCTVTVTEKPTPPIVSVTGVMFNNPNSMTLFVGNEGYLYAVVLPDNATNNDVTWTSSKPGVATVDTKGTVIAVGVGETVITVKTVDGNFTATCTVTVTKCLLFP
jgi:uncharacterized protein YjdB